MKFEINSKSYWNFRFESGSWIGNNGIEQSKFFMNLLIYNIPKDIFHDLLINNTSILDFGCSLGQGCYALSQMFGNNVTGYDFSDVAISKAKEMYPNLNFTSNISELKKVDLLTCSNTLEHLEDTNFYLDQFTDIAQKYIFILIPHKSTIFDEHIASFDENSFPNILNGFKKVFEKVMDTSNSGYWNGEQYLIIYKK